MIQIELITRNNTKVTHEWKFLALFDFFRKISQPATKRTLVRKFGPISELSP